MQPPLITFIIIHLAAAAATGTSDLGPTHCNIDNNSSSGRSGSMPTGPDGSDYASAHGLLNLRLAGRRDGLRVGAAQPWLFVSITTVIRDFVGDDVVFVWLSSSSTRVFGFLKFERWEALRVYEQVAGKIEEEIREDYWTAQALSAYRQWERQRYPEEFRRGTDSEPGSYHASDFDTESD